MKRGRKLRSLFLCIFLQNKKGFQPEVYQSKIQEILNQFSKH